MKLTDALLASFPASYDAATKAPFLELVGRGSVNRADLGYWLQQDLMYASKGYTQAFSQALAKLDPCPIDLVQVRDMTSTPVGRAAKHMRMVKVLAEALVNIAREVDMFVAVLSKHGLAPEIDGRAPTRSASKEGKGRQVSAMAPITQAYLDFMIATASSRSIEETMVLLWATERAYLDSWKYAKGFRTGEVGQGNALRRATGELIDNWTSQPFEDFVQELENIVNDLEIPPDPQNETYCKVEAIFRHVLWLEERFWPDVRQ